MTVPDAAGHATRGAAGRAAASPLLLGTLRDMAEDIGRAFGSLVSSIVVSRDVFDSLRRLLATPTAVRYAVERLGVTEVDVRRIDWKRGSIVLWNGRRLPLPSLSEVESYRPEWSE